MKAEQLNQVLDTIKTLNLNIDSNSAVIITNELKPILWALVLEGYFDTIVRFVLIIALIFLFYKIFFGD